MNDKQDQWAFASPSLALSRVYFSLKYDEGSLQMWWEQIIMITTGWKWVIKDEDYSSIVCPSRERERKRRKKWEFIKLKNLITTRSVTLFRTFPLKWLVLTHIPPLQGALFKKMTSIEDSAELIKFSRPLGNKTSLVVN